MKSLLFALLIVTMVQADYLLELQSNDGKMKFFYKDDLHEKLMLGEDICKSGEIYKIKKRLYSVSYAGGQLIIVDLLKAKNFMGAMGISVTTADPEDVAGIYDDYIITKTSKTKKVAGITAHKWILKDPETNEKEVIYVANSKPLQKVVKGMSLLFGTFSGDTTDYFTIDGGVVVETDDFKLTKFVETDVPRSTYKLPNKRSRVIKKCAKRAKEEEEKLLKEYSTESQESPKQIQSTTHHKKSSSTQKSSADKSITDEDVQKAAELLKSLF